MEGFQVSGFRIGGFGVWNGLGGGVESVDGGRGEGGLGGLGVLRGCGFWV